MHKNNQKNNAGGHVGLNGPEQSAPLFPLAKELSLEEIIERVRREVRRPDMHEKNPPVFDRPESSHSKVDHPAEHAHAIVAQNPELSLEEIMRRVQAEVSRRRNVSAPVAPQPQAEHPGANDRLPRWEPRTRPLPVKSEYVLGDFLQFSDVDFLESAYRALLKRPADAYGREHFLAALRAGHLSKVEVLGLIRFSEEGKRCGVHVDGLLLPYKLHRWRHVRVIGPMLAFAMAIVRLPRLVRHVQALESATVRESHGIGRLINHLDDIVEGRLAGIDGAVDVVRTELLQTIAARVEGFQSIIARADSLQRSVDAQDERLRMYNEERRQNDHEFLHRLDEHDSTLSRLGEEFDTYGVHHEQRINEMRGHLNELGSVTSSLSNEFFAYKASREQRDDDMLQQYSVTSRLNDEILAYKAHREQRDHDMFQQLDAQESAKNRLSDELLAYKDQREERDLDMLRQLNAQDTATSRLSNEFLVYTTHREQRDDEMLRKLNAQNSITSHLSDEFLAYKTDREKCEQEMLQRLDVQNLTYIRLEDEFHSYKSDREQRDQGLLQKLDVQDSATTRAVSSTYENRRSILDIQRRLMMFLDAAATQPARSAASTHEGDARAGDQILNAQYVSFEDEFRGEREDIKTRAAHYLGTLASAGVEHADGIVLDLGCGRGEWLELLTERGYACRGVDLNNVMLEDSQARGFDVVESDAVEYLRELADGSLAAITSMHLVEHLPYYVLIQLLDEALRVLRPGGVLILETPNPENITVGSCWFYLDPTHRNPIPPDLLQWTVRARGFAEPVIERLSEHRGVPDIQPVSEDVPGAAQINQMAAWFTTAPDYAVIAKKPSSDHGVAVKSRSK